MNGGPAFPMHDGFHHESQEGMSLLAYFAAHAPSIPSWFEHTEPARDYPPMPDYNSVDESQRETVRQWQHDPCFELPEELEWYAQKVRAHRAGRHQWQIKNHMARLVQWRFAYAQAMVSQQPKETA